MSDTHRKTDRYEVRHAPGIHWAETVYYVLDTDADEIHHGPTTRTAALAICSRLNGRDVTPDQDREEN